MDVLPLSSAAVLQGVTLGLLAFVVVNVTFTGRYRGSVAAWLYGVTMLAFCCGLLLSPYQLPMRSVLGLHLLTALFAAGVIRLLFHLLTKDRMSPDVRRALNGPRLEFLDEAAARRLRGK